MQAGRDAPVAEAPTATLPGGLGLYVWGTLASAPGNSAVKQRRQFWIDVATDRVNAVVTGLEITTVRIDTEQKSASIETVPREKWVFALDGRLHPRTSSKAP